MTGVAGSNIFLQFQATSCMKNKTPSGLAFGVCGTIQPCSISSAACPTRRCGETRALGSQRAATGSRQNINLNWQVQTKQREFCRQGQSGIADAARASETINEFERLLSATADRCCHSATVQRNFAFIPLLRGRYPLMLSLWGAAVTQRPQLVCCVVG
jgi:hypothetical protein